MDGSTNKRRTVLYAFAVPVGKEGCFEEAGAAGVAVAIQLCVEIDIIMADIVFGERFDLANETTFGGFVGIINTGRVHAALAALHCSPFSRVRDGQAGPWRSRVRPEPLPVGKRAHFGRARS